MKNRISMNDDEIMSGEEFKSLYPAESILLDKHFDPWPGSDYKTFWLKTNSRLTLESTYSGWYAKFHHGAVSGDKTVYSGRPLELCVIRILEFMDDDPFIDDPMEE